jgi:argininosuccinate synthase
MPDSIVLAYSGGLDTSIGVHWLTQHYKANVTAVLVDLGQDPQQTQEAKSRAIANGAAACIVIPAAKEFAAEHLGPAILANALYEGAYPLGTALARPLIAKHLVETAQKIGADAVAHGCTGKGNDQVRIENGIRALDPTLEILAPQRTHPMDRPQAIEYANEHNLELPPLKQSKYSIDENLWTRSIEGGDLEDPGIPPAEDAYQWTTSPVDAPDAGQTVTLGFENGLPVTLDGQVLPLSALIATLNQLMGANGIGRIDHVESRIVGIKSREIYEAPAAISLLTAKKALEALTLTRDELHAKAPQETQFARLIYDGHHWSPLRKATQAYLTILNEAVEGEVTLHARQGHLQVTSRKSPQSLYDTALATYGSQDAFDHHAATGFLEISGLPLATAAQARKKTPTNGHPTPLVTGGGPHHA